MTTFSIFIAIVVAQAFNIIIIIWTYFILRNMGKENRIWIEESIKQMQESLAELIQRENSMLRGVILNLWEKPSVNSRDKKEFQNRYVSFECVTAAACKDRSSTAKASIQVMDRDSQRHHITTLFVICCAIPGYNGDNLEQEIELFVNAYSLFNERYRLPQAKDKPVLFLFPSPHGNMANNDMMVFNGIVIYGLKPSIEHIQNILIYSRNMQCMTDGICITIDPRDLGTSRQTVRRGIVASNIAFHLRLAENERDNLTEFYFPC